MTARLTPEHFRKLLSERIFILDGAMGTMIQQHRLEELQQQLDLLKATRGAGTNEVDKQALEKRINQYLREIDKCIALLNE